MNAIRTISLIIVIASLSACNIIHVYSPGHGPDANLFMGEYSIYANHTFHPLLNELPCPPEDATETEARKHWMDQSNSIHDELGSPTDDTYVIVWDMREDCPWQGGLTQQLVIPPFVFARHVSYLGWRKGDSVDFQYYAMFHEILHQMGLRHCDVEQEGNPCIPPYNPPGLEIEL